MKKYDVIVAGGGFSGVSAAISAAREKCSVLIVDKNNCFGGAATVNLVNPFMSTATVLDGESDAGELSRGIYKEFCDELKKYDAFHLYTFKEEYLKYILNNMVIAENIDILFNSYITDVTRVDKQIESITVSNKSGNTKYYANYFIDATGDADVAAMSGWPYHLGREDSLCQPMTLCFRLCNVDIEMYKKENSKIQEMYKEFQKKGYISNPREDILSFYVPIDGIVHFNTTRIVKRNPVDALDVTLAEIEARNQVMEMVKFLKENTEAFKNSDLIITAAQIGVRESRMIEGEYVLKESDIVNCTRFEDSIAVGNYDIDIHNPEGSGTSHYYFKKGEYYTIPYRTLVPKNCDNLLVTGRCISITHEVQASCRIMPICATLGQAAGIAVSLAVKEKSDVKSVDVKCLQDRLKALGAFIGI